MRPLELVPGSEVISRLENLVRTEKENTEEVILHLAEIEVRKLYVILGYNSLFDYATRRLGYSESAAVRRIGVARAGAKLPEIFDLLKQQKVNLSALTACSRVLQKENGAEVLEELKGKTKKEAEWIAAAHEPLPPLASLDRVEKLVIKKPEENTIYLRSEGELFDRKLRISFAADPEFMKKVERAQEITFRGDKTEIQFEAIFSKALECYLDKHDPIRRNERRERALQKRTELKARRATKEEVISDRSNVARDCVVPSRYISETLRDEVLKRDNYECTYPIRPGVKCGCRTTLEIDHIVPFAVGGKSVLENLRTLCSMHNKHAAREVFGDEFVEERITGRRSRSDYNRKEHAVRSVENDELRDENSDVGQLSEIKSTEQHSTIDAGKGSANGRSQDDR